MTTSQIIYRNGKFERDSTQSILLRNLGVFFVPIAMGVGINIALYKQFDYSDLIVNSAILAIFVLAGIIGYVYRTITRIKPLAKKDGDELVININLFSKKKIDLSLTKKVTCQAETEHDKFMKVFYQGKAPMEFVIKQTNCSTEDLGSFIKENHDIEVRYS